MDTLHDTEQADVHKHAAKLLRQDGHLVKRIIAVHPDSILFEGAQARAMTAWTRAHGDRVLVVTEVGFAAEPSAFTLKKLAEQSEALNQLASE